MHVVLELVLFCLPEGAARNKTLRAGHAQHSSPSMNSQHPQSPRLSPCYSSPAVQVLPHNTCLRAARNSRAPHPFGGRAAEQNVDSSSPSVPSCISPTRLSFRRLCSSSSVEELAPGFYSCGWSCHSWHTKAALNPVGLGRTRKAAVSRWGFITNVHDRMSITYHKGACARHHLIQ